MVHLFSSAQRRRQAKFAKWLAIMSAVGGIFAPALFVFSAIFALASFGAARKARLIDEHYREVARVMKEAA